MYKLYVQFSTMYKHKYMNDVKTHVINGVQHHSLIGIQKLSEAMYTKLYTKNGRWFFDIYKNNTCVFVSDTTMLHVLLV